jgi:hypothetical protein
MENLGINIGIVQSQCVDPMAVVVAIAVGGKR